MSSILISSSFCHLNARSKWVHFAINVPEGEFSAEGDFPHVIFSAAPNCFNSRGPKLDPSEPYTDEEAP
jgi:hypothetical protein